MRLLVAAALLLVIAPACASQATSKAETGEFFETDENIDVVESAGPTNSSTTTIECRVVIEPPPPNVGLGDCGAFVIDVQTRLNSAGFIIPIDGVYSDLTEDAVKAFQTDRGLTVDGLVGPKTWKELLEDGN